MKIIETSNFYLVIVLLIILSCSGKDDPKPFDCSTTAIVLSTTPINPITCASNDGSIAVLVTSGGKAPFEYKLGSSVFQASSIFSSLATGEYIIVVRDANKCTKQINAALSVPGGPTIGLISSQNSGCKSTNGSITVQATGSGVLTYRVNGGAFQLSNQFLNLSKGTYSIGVKDAGGCETFTSKAVASGISYSSSIKTILEINCIKSGCHNGDNGADRNWSVFANVQAKAAGIKSRTADKSMPKDIAPTGLSQSQIDLIACWVDDGALDN